MRTRMERIHFIVNPIAGSGNNTFSETFLQDYFETEKYNIAVKYSEHKEHAIQLTKESIQEQANIIVACGGDGTINEVASTLVGTSITLGIVPIGSGNGLASNLNIPKDIKKALHVIKNNETLKIDVGCVNRRFFFSNTGFGFDADVIQNYEASSRRTLFCYIKASLKSFREYPKKEIVININKTSDIVNPFLIFISNSNEMGYNFSLTPKASLQDGLLDVLIVPKINKLKMMLFGFCMLIKKPELLKDAKYYQTNALTLSRKQGDFFQSQIDGELSIIKDDTVSVTIKKEALNVLV